MIPDEAWELVPQAMPEDIPDWAPRFSEAAAFDERELRSYAWAASLLDQVDRQLLATAIIGVTGEAANVEDVSAGFIPIASYDQVSLRAARIRAEDVRTVETPDALFAFGVVIGVSTSRSRAGELRPIQREPPTLGAMVGIYEFPVVVEFRDVVRHAPPIPRVSRPPAMPDRARVSGSSDRVGPQESSSLVTC